MQCIPDTISRDMASTVRWLLDDGNCCESFPCAASKCNMTDGCTYQGLYTILATTFNYLAASDWGILGSVRTNYSSEEIKEVSVDVKFIVLAFQVSRLWSISNYEATSTKQSKTVLCILYSVKGCFIILYIRLMYLCNKNFSLKNIGTDHTLVTH